MDYDDYGELPTDELYMTIAKAIIDAISEDWLTATAYAEIEEDDNGMTSGKYIPAAKPDSINYFDPPLEIYLAFDELRRRMRRPDAAPWVKARFILQSNGHFDLDFTYPDAI